MSDAARSLSEQDALSNAFLAVFAILVLLLVQTGLTDVLERLEAQALGPVPTDLTSPSGGTGAIATLPLGALVYVMGPAAVDIQTMEAAEFLSRDDSATASPQVLLAYQRQAPDKDAYVYASNPTGRPLAIWIAIDSTPVGGEPALLQPGESITLALCSNGGAFAFRGRGDHCP